MWLWRWLWWVIAFYGAVCFQEDGGGGVIAVMVVVNWWCSVMTEAVMK